MESGIVPQAAALLLAALLGLGAGLLYDLLRPPRRAMRRAWAALIDLLYALCVGIGLFLFAMSAGEGRLGLWELGAALAGFLVYLHLLSPVFLPLFDAAAAGTARGLESLGKSMKNFNEKRKKYFQKRKECYIMKKCDRR